MSDHGLDPECGAASDKRPGPGATEALVMYLVLVCYALFLGPVCIRAFGKASTIVFTAGFGLIPLLYTRARGYDFRSVFSLRRPSGRQIGGGLLFAAGIFLLVYLASGIAASLIPAMRRNSGRVDAGIAAMPFWLGIVEIVLLPAVFEELLFRGFIQSGLRRAAGRIWTVVLCGVLFGLMHGDLSRIPFTAILGIALACALRETSSLAVPVTMHAAHNLVLFLMIRASSAARLADASGTGFEAALVLLLGLWILAGCILARVGYCLLVSSERTKSVSIEVEDI